MVVFCLRYWDLFLYFVSLYNSTMKLVFLSSTAYTIYLMKSKKPFCLSYDKTNDSFEHFKYIYTGNFKFKPFDYDIPRYNPYDY